MENWLVYGTVVVILLAFDLGFLNKDDKVIGFKKSLYLSLFYFLVACLFGLYIYSHLGGDKAKEYYTGFFIEKAMALDNIFVISMIFKFFAVPAIYQHRVLFWGIFGVILLRAIMITAGAVLITKFSWILYLFAVILLVTGMKLFYLQDKDFKVQDLFIYKILQKHLNITSEIKNHDFFTKIDEKIYATPLFISLLIIESMDVIFAIDSIPAIFAITNDIFIVYTSNIFAILGLRALFFCLNEMTEKFKYIKYSLALILIFISIKIFISHILPIAPFVSLSITVILLSGGIAVSLMKK